MLASNWTSRERGVGDDEECSHNMMRQGCWLGSGRVQPPGAHNQTQGVGCAKFLTANLLLLAG
jgi:hypothetical protein